MAREKLQISPRAIELRSKAIELSKNHPELAQALGAATHVDIQNVADYFWTQTSKEFWDPCTDITSVRCPWPNAWMTYKVPQFSNNEGTILKLTKEQRPTVGILVRETVQNNGMIVARYTIFLDLPPVSDKLMGYEIAATINPGGSVEMPANGRWQIVDPTRPDVCRFEHVMGLSKESHPVFLTCTVAMLACAFANCKNVKQDIVEHEPHSKKARRCLGEVKHIYRVLRITNFSGDDHSASENTDGAQRDVAYHICRGHFADYRKGKGLFGKYHGRFWIPQHVKGNRKHGSVTKDYMI